MIEVYALYKFCKLLGYRLRAKGRDPIRFQWLLVVLWLAFEFIGGIAGALLFQGAMAGTYLCALTGAAGAVAILLPRVNHLPAKPEPPPEAASVENKQESA